MPEAVKERVPVIDHDCVSDALLETDGVGGGVMVSEALAVAEPLEVVVTL